MKQQPATRERPSPRPRNRPENEPEDDAPAVEVAISAPPDAVEELSRSEADSSEEEHVPQGKRPHRWRWIVVAVLSVLTAGTAAAAVFAYLQVRADTENDRLRAEAVQVAGQQAVNLLTVNGQNVDGQLAALTGNSTGDFRRQFEGISKTFGDVVRQGKVDSTGRVEVAGLDQLTADTARVQLALTSSVTNAQATTPETRQYRITVDLERKENRWLVAGMQFVP